MIKIGHVDMLTCFHAQVCSLSALSGLRRQPELGTWAECVWHHGASIWLSLLMNTHHVRVHEVSCPVLHSVTAVKSTSSQSGSDQFTLNTHNAMTLWLGTGWKISTLGGFSKCLKLDASVLSVKYHLHYAVLIIVAPNDHQRWLWIYYIFWCIYLCGVPLWELRCLYMSNNAELGQLVI